MQPVELFISCSHADKASLRDLLEHLAPLVHGGQLAVWTSLDLKGGDDWDREIKRHLRSAHVIAFMVSPSLLSSSYCNEVELPVALEQEKTRRAHILPIVVRPALWEETPLKRFQAMPARARAVDLWRSPHEAWLDVARGVKRVIEEVHAEDRRLTALCEQIRARMSRYCTELLAIHFPRGLLRSDTPPAHLQRLVVPLDLGSRDDAHGPGGAQRAWADLAASLAEEGRSVHAFIEGAPGAGKTTLAVFVARWIAENSAARVPVLLQLRDSTPRIEASFRLPELLGRELRERHQLDVEDERLVHALLHSGRLTFLVDGLDYLRSDEEKDTLCRSVPPDTSLMITSRSDTYAPHPSVALTHLRIRSLRGAQLCDLLRRWCQFKAQDPEDCQRMYDRLMAVFRAPLDGSRAARGFEWTPLLATYLAASHQTIGSSPTRRAEVYDNFVTWIFGALADIARRPFECLSHTKQRRYLEMLALSMVERNEHDLSRCDLERRILALAERQSGEVITKWVDYLLRDAGLLVERRARISFVHHTILEYFAGRGFRARHESAGYREIVSQAMERLERRTAYARWAEVFLLLFGGDQAGALPELMLAALVRRVLEMLSVPGAAAGDAGPAGAADETTVWELVTFGLRLLRETELTPPIEGTARDLLDALARCALADDNRVSPLAKGSRADVEAVADLLAQLSRDADPAHGQLVRSWLSDLLRAESLLPLPARRRRMLRWGLVVPSVLLGQTGVSRCKEEDAGAIVTLLKLWPYSDLGRFIAGRAGPEDVVGWARSDSPIHLVAPRALVFLEASWDEGAAAWTLALLRRAAWISALSGRAAVEVEWDLSNRCQVELWSTECTLSAHLWPSIVPASPGEAPVSTDVHRLETQTTERALRTFYARLRHEARSFRAVMEVAEKLRRAFVTTLPQKLWRHVVCCGSIEQSILRTWRAAVASGAVTLPYGPEASQVIREGEWSHVTYEEGVLAPDEAVHTEWSTEGELGERDGIGRRSLVRHWVETLIGVVEGKLAGSPSGWMLGSLRAQNWWFHLFWDDLAESLGPTLESRPGHMALMLAAALAQYQTTWRWPGGRRWAGWFRREPAVFREDPRKYWLARCAWHLCWIVSRADARGVHRAGLRAGLQDGARQWKALSDALRELNVAAA